MVSPTMTVLKSLNKSKQSIKGGSALSPAEAFLPASLKAIRKEFRGRCFTVSFSYTDDESFTEECHKIEIANTEAPYPFHYRLQDRGQMQFFRQKVLSSPIYRYTI